MRPRTLAMLIGSLLLLPFLAIGLLATKAVSRLWTWYENGKR